SGFIGYAARLGLCLATNFLRSPMEARRAISALRNLTPKVFSTSTMKLMCDSESQRSTSWAVVSSDRLSSGCWKTRRATSSMRAWMAFMATPFLARTFPSAAGRLDFEEPPLRDFAQEVVGLAIDVAVGVLDWRLQDAAQAQAALVQERGQLLDCGNDLEP